MINIYEQGEPSDLIIIGHSLERNSFPYKVKIKDSGETHYCVVGNDNSIDFFDSNSRIYILDKTSFLNILNKDKRGYLKGYEYLLLPNFTGKINLDVVSNINIDNKDYFNTLNIKKYNPNVSILKEDDNKNSCVLYIDSDNISSKVGFLNYVPPIKIKGHYKL